jgi:hypothetical protein
LVRDDRPNWFEIIVLAVAAGFGALVALMFLVHWIRG